MNKTKQVALHFAAAALLVGTSAFADSRPSDATTRYEGRRHDRGDRGTVQQQSGQRDSSRSFQQPQRTETRNWDRNNNQNRSFDRNNNRSYDSNRTYNNNRSYDSSRGFNNNRSYDSSRSFDRNRGYENNRGYVNGGYANRGGYSGSYSRGNAYYHDGRISRIDRWNGGYRVYIGGAPYPFFIPEARFSLFNWRVGLSVHLGGFYNPLGYYDYYDVAPYAGTVASAGDVHGIVESVDYRRGSMVVRDDVSGSFVTVMMRGGDPSFDALRIGDSVELSGDWVRGYFEAFRVDRLDAGYDGNYYRR